MPSIQSLPRHRPVMAQPSSSSIAMQGQGLEIPLGHYQSPPSSHEDPFHDDLLGSNQFTHPEPQSPIETVISKSSSLYSTRSARSSDSLDSAETTISHIVDMYTDLINKIPYDDDSLPEVQILQPKVYRETLVPLLTRRFSAEQSDQTYIPVPPIPSIPPLRTYKKRSEPSLRSSYKQAPGFQEFSRNLRDRRAELVSPLSVSPRGNQQQQLSIDSLSEPSPVTPQTRPFSWTSDGVDVMLGIDTRVVFPLHNLNNTNGSTAVFETQRKTHEFRTELPGQLNDKAQDSSRGRATHLSNSQKDANGPCLPYSAKMSESPKLAHRESNPEQHHRHRSTASDSTDSFVIYTGIGEVVKAMIKDKIKRRKEAKDKLDVMTTASQKYPGMKNSSPQPETPFKERRRSSLKEGLDTFVRRLSATSPNKASAPTHPPRRREKQAAIPLTPYQKYGIEVWFAENKKKRKEERRREREANQLHEPHSPTRPKSEGIYRPRHRRSLSTKTFETATSQTSLGKKGSFKAALEGARNGLTQSAADKRREKLKESIVLVGPTQLTIANAGVDRR